MGTPWLACLAGVGLCACQLPPPLPPPDGGAVPTGGSSTSGGSTGIGPTGGSSSGGSTGAGPTSGGSTGAAAGASTGASTTSGSSGGSSSGGGSSSWGLSGPWECTPPGLGSFTPQVTYPVGATPDALAVGDFDGDGTLNLAVVNNDFGGAAGSVSVLINSGLGSFSTLATYPLGNPNAVAVGDFNGDGKLDFAVADARNNLVSVFLNGGSQGHTAFTLQSTYPVDNGGSVAVGDFNGDGQPDLAVSDGVDNEVVVLLNQGGGSFGEMASYDYYDVEGDPLSLAVGDFDGDGRPDLAVTNFGASSVSVLLNGPGGVFQPPVAFTVGSLPFSVAVGDFNGDGKPDLVVANNNQECDGGNCPGTVSVLLNGGGGTFAAQMTYATGSDPASVAVGDFAGDGTLGFAVAINGESSVDVFRGPGDGTFAAPIILAWGGNPDAVAVGDFNGDGRPDLAVANYSDATVGVQLDKGPARETESFTAPAPHAVEQHPRAVAVGDFNGDGKQDLAVANTTSNLPDGGPGPGTVSVLLNLGDGGFASQVTYGSESVPTGVAVGDFNGDGRPDLAVVNQIGGDAGTVNVLLNQPDGGFGPELPYAVGVSPQALAVGDFDGDGKSDLAVANLTDGTLSLLFGLGDGDFAPQVTYVVGQEPYSVAVGDFNGDGKPDLAVANSYCSPSNSCPGTVSVLLNRGDGGFAAQVHYTVGISPYSVVVGDFNGDGKLDLAAANQGDATVMVLLNSGDGTFAAPATYAVGQGPSSLAVGDFNGDGLPDLAVGSTGNDAVNVLVNQGGGLFEVQLALVGGSVSPIALAAGDFNGDGLLDLAVADYANAQAVLLFNSCGP